MTDLARLTATEARRRIAAGTLSPAALMEACLAAIEAGEPQVRAMSFIDPDAARRAADAAVSGPLQGLPVGVKDVLDTADMPTGYGSPIWDGWRPRADSAPVAWTRAAGGVVIGKTVTTEFATRFPGPTTNPRNPAHTPGGSSSGSAAGVAANFFPLAIGTQTGGSVIRPAAYCGIVGFKPSFGFINRHGMKIMSDSLDTIGVFARSVADCALFAGAIGLRELGDPEAAPGRAPRIGICRTPVWDKAAPETHALLERVAAAVARAGAAVEERELPPRFADLIWAHPAIMNNESARAMGWEWATARDKLSEVLRNNLAFGLARSADEMARAYEVFRDTQAMVPQAMEGLDILLTPAAPGEAPHGLTSTGDASLNMIWTSTHVPCVSVPAGEGPNGLPLGIQIVARRGEDAAALAWARWVEQAVA